MLKLVKYEYRRNLTGIVAMLGMIALLEGFFLVAIERHELNWVISASMLLFTAAMFSVLGLLIYSVALYSRELNAKTSYLTFMTPNSAYKILGAKLLAALLLGIFFAFVLGGLAVWDFELVRFAYPEIDLMGFMMQRLLESSSSPEIMNILTTVAMLGIEFLVTFFSTVIIAYLAITLSATVLQNKRLKGLLSFILFLVIIVALNYGTSLMSAGRRYWTLREMVIADIPQFAVYLAVSVGAFWLSAWLLDKKVSL